jgi:hypothetical protein
VANEMNNGVAMGDIDVELIECVAAEVLKILLHLHFHIVPRKIAAQIITIGAEFIGYSRKRNFDRHECVPAKLIWTRPLFHIPGLTEIVGFPLTARSYQNFVGVLIADRFAFTIAQTARIDDAYREAFGG